MISIRRTLVALFLALGFAARPALAFIEAEGYYWYMIPDGTVAVGDRGVAGTTLDLEQDLDFDSFNSVLGLTGIVGDMHQFGLNLFTLDISATARADRDITFGDETFPRATKITSDWEGLFLRGYYRLNIGASFARAGVLAGGQYVDVSTGLSAPGIGSASEDLSAVMPIIGGFFVGHPLPFLGFRGSVIGSSWDLGDLEATFIDVELAGEMTFVGGFFAAGGYRFTSIDVSDSDQPLDIDVSLSGPIFYIGFEW